MSTPAADPNVPPRDEEDFGSPDACIELKQRHDECFFRWYNTKFLSGKATEMECGDEWNEYNVCLKVKSFLCKSFKIEKIRSHRVDSSRRGPKSRWREIGEIILSLSCVSTEILCIKFETQQFSAQS